MPKEVNKKAPNRWEGTHTYAKANQTKKRTVAQIQEETAARIRADREKRRIGVEKLRRNSIAACAGVGTGSNNDLSAETEEIFFDATEEDMPGSNKKRRQQSGTNKSSTETPMDEEAVPPQPPPTPQPPGVDPAMLELLMSIKSDINQTTNTAVGRVDKKIEENARAIRMAGQETAEEMKKMRQQFQASQSAFEERIERRVAEGERKMERRIVALENRKISQSPTKATTLVSGKQEEAYRRSRCTLKMWPVTGADLMDAVRVFMRTKLKIDDEKIADIALKSVKLSVGKAAKDRSEVIVLFECRDDRDYVKSMGVNLAGEKDLGMAIHVPGHLLDNFYALNSIGYSIKSNNQGVKRSIKFDDATQNIYLDIYIGGQWRKILPDEAKAAIKANPGVSSSASSRSIDSQDLVNLAQGNVVAGITAVVVGEEEENNGAQGHNTDQ